MQYCDACLKEMPKSIDQYLLDVSTPPSEDCGFERIQNLMICQSCYRSIIKILFTGPIKEK